MSLIFYPHSDDIRKGSLNDRIEILMEAAERYKAVVLDTTLSPEAADLHKRIVPRDQTVAYNWEEIAAILGEIRGLPEGGKEEKTHKADCLTKLAEIYEVLRTAKMPKLEAVRLALITEANQLHSGSSQVT